MKILFVGEIVAGPGRKAVKEVLPWVISDYKPDLVLSNAENLSGGRGVTEENLQQMITCGINFFTSGDHIFWEKGTEDFIDNVPLVIPANYPKRVPGKRYEILDTGKNGKVLIFNLLGRSSGGLNCYVEDPFTTADKILEETAKENIAVSILDFHADVTSEKYAIANYLDGRVTAIIGSHSHVPTCDQMVMPKGTMYITDVGMTGIIDSVIGVKSEIIIKQFLTAQNQRFEWEDSGRKAFRSVLLDTREMTISRVDKLLV